MHLLCIFFEMLANWGFCLAQLYWEAMETMGVIWRELQQVTQFSLRFRARGQAERLGEGVVSVERQGAQALLFVERGEWSDGKQRLSFTNRSRWTLGGSGLRLEHLRRAEPVFLLELESLGIDHFLAKQPHLCGQDRYHAELKRSPAGIQLSWRIRGPSKDDELHYLYTKGPGC